MYEQHYVEIEGKWHTAGTGERTECGMVIPYPGTPYTRVVPDGRVHCGGKPEAEVEEPATKVVEDEKPAKAKATK